jgi:hypothetical protein
VIENDGRPEWTRTIDLFRDKPTTNTLYTCQTIITGKNRRFRLVMVGTVWNKVQFPTSWRVA